MQKTDFKIPGAFTGGTGPILLGESPRKKGLMKKIVSRTIIYLIMTALAAVLVFPYFYMVARSVMPGDQVMYTSEIIPYAFSLDGWSQVFVGDTFFQSTLQTLLIAAFNIIAVPLSASFVAYGFAKIKYAGRGFVFALMMGTMMLPGVVLQTPLYLLFASFGWLNSILPLTVPNLFGGGAMYIFLIRQYMIGLPKEIDEAAKIDGANLAVRFLRITLPLCVPILIFIVVTVFGANWNDFYQPLIYMPNAKTPPLALAVYLEAANSNGKYITPDKANIRMALGVFMSLFPAILFVVFQKQLIEGVSTSAIKG